MGVAKYKVEPEHFERYPARPSEIPQREERGEVEHDNKLTQKLTQKTQRPSGGNGRHSEFGTRHPERDFVGSTPA